MTQNYAYAVPGGLNVVGTYEEPGKPRPVAKVACKCCRLPTPVTPTNTKAERVVCPYCFSTCKEGAHVPCKDTVCCEVA